MVATLFQSVDGITIPNTDIGGSFWRRIAQDFIAAPVEIAATLLIFIAVYQLFDDTNAVAIGALRGYKDTRFPMVFGLVGYWLFAFPLGYGLSEELIFPGLAPGVYGYWTALTIGLGLVATAMAIRLRLLSGNAEKIRTLAAT